MKKSLFLITALACLAIALPVLAGQATAVRAIISGSIKSLSYDLGQARLTLNLKDGTEYRFGSVPESVYRDFKVAENRGAYFNRKIRKHYPCVYIRTVPAEPAEEQDPHAGECSRYRYH